MKKVLVLNAGHTEIPMIEELKELGCYVITSGNREDMPGHSLADKYIKEDYSDKDAILKVAMEEKIDAIVSNAYDLGMVTSSYVAEKMGLPGHDSFTVTSTLHQKDLFKEVCVELGIRVPYSKQFTLAKDAISYLDGVEYPIMIKATDQASGIGIKKVANYKEAIGAINEAFASSKKKTVLVEEFIEGLQQSFVAFVINGKIKTCMTCNCYSPINPYLIQTETMPGDFFQELKPELVEIVEKLFAKYSLVDGLITIQYIVKNGKPYVIEMMRRCLGNRFLLPISVVTGFNWYKALVMAEMGLDCSKIEIGEPKAKFAGHHAIMATKNGIFEKYSIPEKLNENIFEQYQLVEKGHVINNYLHERMGYIYYLFDNKEDLDNAALNFNKWIKVDYLEG